MTKNKVFLVDDDPRIGRLIARAAKRKGIEPTAIDQPEEFSDAYDKVKPDLILLDLQMPRLDGVELLRLLAKKKSKSAIVLTSGMDKSVLQTTMSLGRELGLNMSGFLQKPLQLDALMDLLDKQFSLGHETVIQKTSFSTQDISDAMDRNEFTAYYQPQIDLSSGEMTGVEALARWSHPELGLLPPSHFITAVEQDRDLARKLLFLILNEVFVANNALQKQGKKINFSVNLAAISLQDLYLPDLLFTLINDAKFDPERLFLEVTESGAMQDPVLSMDILTRLRLKNIKLSIDDFGTGFSSLLQLYRLPFNELKIDRSFVMEALQEKEAATIVKLTVDLGHQLGLKVVAEGIEDLATSQWLRELGCDYGQGYYFAKPMRVDELLTWAPEL
jgi:EAL domain-containing protein (putative c-di-GMP-specific phosphodiesterase class I)